MKNPIPMPVWEQHVAILAKTGRGKTITAKGGASTLMKHGMRCGVVDPTGAWWGMRLKADGKTDAFPMVIFGGDHGDIFIDARFDKSTRYDPRGIGEKIGALVAAADWSWIVDISKLNTDNRAPFMTGFAESLFAENKRRLNLFLDECHLYMPQQKLPTRASSHMTAACNNLVSGGRGRGLNITMISQRSAKVHKDSLTQAETMITLGMIAPHDIAAAEAWVKVQGDMKVAKKMLESLPSLPVGTGWIYAPELGMLEKVKFPMIDTFDSSRAPGVGEDMRAPTELGQINLEEIRAKLAPPGRKTPLVQKSSTLGQMLSAPNEATKGYLASQMAQERSLAAAREEGAESIRSRIHAILDGQHAVSFQMGVEWARDAAVAAAKGILNPDLMPARRPLRGMQDAIAKPVKALAAPIQSREHQIARKSARAAAAAPAVRSAPAAGLSKPQMKILESLAWWKRLGFDSPTRVQVGIKAKIKAKGGHFKTRLSELSTAGLVTYPSTDTIQFTPSGAEVAPEPNIEETVVESLRPILSAPQSKIFDAMLRGYSDRESIAAEAGMDAAGGHFKTRLSELSSMGIVSYPDKRTATLETWVIE